MVLSNNQDLRSVQAREAMNDGKAPKEDPDAEFEFRDDVKRVLLEAMGARMFTLENYETILAQIYSE